MRSHTHTRLNTLGRKGERERERPSFSAEEEAINHRVQQVELYGTCAFGISQLYMVCVSCLHTSWGRGIFFFPWREREKPSRRLFLTSTTGWSHQLSSRKWKTAWASFINWRWPFAATPSLSIRHEREDARKWINSDRFSSINQRCIYPVIMLIIMIP